jgi:hypothetical protein
MNPAVDVSAVAAPIGAAEQPSGACPHPGCRVPREMVRFKGSDGRAWCISHVDDQRAKQSATTKGGDAKRRKEKRVMPPDTPTPDWSTPKSIRAWAEDRAGRVERGQLDQKHIPHELAKLAKATHDTELLERLDSLEAMLRGRLGGGA